MNLTVNIPIDFSDLESCKQIVESVNDLPGKIRDWSNRTTSDGEEGPFAMTREEIDQTTAFLRDLAGYCDKPPLNFEINVGK